MLFCECKISIMKQVKGLFINVFKTYQSGSHRFISSKKLVFHEFGEPVKVVNVVEEELPKVMSTEVSLAEPFPPQ